MQEIWLFVINFVGDLLNYFHRHHKYFLMYPISISYRRSDLNVEAEWLYQVISTFFGKNIAFFDKEEIEVGQAMGWHIAYLYTCINHCTYPRWSKMVKGYWSDAYV